MTSDDLSSEPVERIVTDEAAGTRLDVWLALHFREYSRVHMRRVINAGGANVNGKRVKASHRLSPGDTVRVTLPEIPRATPKPEKIPLEVLYEDAALAVINKPPRMVVHPGKGHWAGTLTSALQFHFDELSGAGGPTRPGIVHRLDRDTSGVILIAKNDRAHDALARQFADRTVEKEYFAIVVGSLNFDRDTIDAPIGLHPHHREKMAIREHDAEARPAQTHYEVIERFRGFTAVKLTPKTGRTHQIRVHMAHIGHPVLCDRLYAGHANITRERLMDIPTEEGDIVLSRQALHARRIKLAHPMTGDPVEFTAPLPADIEIILEALRQTRAL